jgi:hypothetical protein
LRTFTNFTHFIVGLVCLEPLDEFLPSHVRDRENRSYLWLTRSLVLVIEGFPGVLALFVFGRDELGRGYTRADTSVTSRLDLLFDIVPHGFRKRDIHRFHGLSILRVWSIMAIFVIFCHVEASSDMQEVSLQKQRSKDISVGFSCCTPLRRPRNRVSFLASTVNSDIDSLGPGLTLLGESYSRVNFKIPRVTHHQKVDY